MHNMKRTVKLAESDLHKIISEAVKSLLSESDAEYNDFFSNANSMERDDRFAYIMDNIDHERLLNLMYTWFEGLDNGEEMDKFMNHCLNQFAPKQDYWTQVRNIYNSPIISTDD